MKVYSPADPALELLVPPVKFSRGVADVGDEVLAALRPNMRALGITMVEPTAGERRTARAGAPDPVTVASYSEGDSSSGGGDGDGS